MNVHSSGGEGTAQGGRSHGSPPNSGNPGLNAAEYRNGGQAPRRAVGQGQQRISASERHCHALGRKRMDGSERGTLLKNVSRGLMDTVVTGLGCGAPEGPSRNTSLGRLLRKPPGLKQRSLGRLTALLLQTNRDSVSPTNLQATPKWRFQLTSEPHIRTEKSLPAVPTPSQQRGPLSQELPAGWSQTGRTGLGVGGQEGEPGTEQAREGTGHPVRWSPWSPQSSIL